MKLLTKELLKKLPKLGENEKEGRVNEKDVTAWVKLFTPDSSWTWWITEYDPETQKCFGFIQGLERELGEFNLKELEEVRGPLGLPIERDLHFDPTPLNKIMETD